MRSVKVLCEVDSTNLQTVLSRLPSGSQIISIYGFSGQHWAWVSYSPEPDTKTKTEKKDKLNGNIKKI